MQAQIIYNLNYNNKAQFSTISLKHKENRTQKMPHLCTIPAERKRPLFPAQKEGLFLFLPLGLKGCHVRGEGCS